MIRLQCGSARVPPFGTSCYPAPGCSWQGTDSALNAVPMRSFSSSINFLFFTLLTGDTTGGGNFLLFFSSPETLPGGGQSYSFSLRTGDIIG